MGNEDFKELSEIIYALNDRLLSEQEDLWALKTAIKIIERQNTIASEDKQKLYEFLKDFSGRLELLDDHDHKQLKDKGKSTYSAVIIEPKESASYQKHAF